MVISITAKHRPPPPDLMGEWKPPHWGLPGGSFFKKCLFVGLFTVSCRIFCFCAWTLYLWCSGCVAARGGPHYPTAHGILVPGPGIESMSPTLEGRFLTTGHQGSPYQEVLYGWPRQPAPSPSEAPSLRRVEMDLRDWVLLSGDRRGFWGDAFFIPQGKVLHFFWINRPLSRLQMRHSRPFSPEKLPVQPIFIVIGGKFTE